MTPSAGVVMFGVLVLPFLATAIVCLFFANRVRAFAARQTPGDTRPTNPLQPRTPSVATIRFYGVIMAALTATAIGGVIFWASKL